MEKTEKISCDYFVVKNLIEQPVRDLLADHLLECLTRYKKAVKAYGLDKVLADKFKYGYYRTEYSSKSYSGYGNLILEDLLATLTPRIEDITQLQLNPSYTFFSVYQHGEELKKHIDRDYCEITLSINLGQDKSNTPFPIYIEDQEVLVHPGEGIIFQGNQYYHHREAFKGTYCCQAFFHWTNKQGEFKDIIYDKRPFLGDKPLENDDYAYRSTKSDEKYPEHPDVLKNHWSL